MDNLSGLRRLMSLLGPEFSMVVSDQTGVFPGEPGVGERLGFIYRWNTVERMEVGSRCAAWRWCFGSRRHDCAAAIRYGGWQWRKVVTKIQPAGEFFGNSLA